MKTWNLIVCIALQLSHHEFKETKDIHSDLDDSESRVPRVRKTTAAEEIGSKKPRRKASRTVYTGTPTFCTKTNLSDYDQAQLYSRISQVVEDKFPTAVDSIENCMFEEPKWDELTEQIRKNYSMKDAATNRYLRKHMYKASSDWQMDYTAEGKPMQQKEYFSEARFNHVTNRTMIPIRQSWLIRGK